ncbi:MAG TPA: GlsB/YeaQ/YmgE family stress response membrane protein [Thermoanaerobaculia bacterium]|nr:GlsB/YeaQ/YmgE family stress response membrane protein [Thermoanaerobaculia bacterium]
MSLLAWIVLGLIAGLIAKALVPGRDPGGCIVTVLIGIAGALLGGWLSTLLGFGGLAGGLDLRNLVIAVLGAIVLLVLWRLLHGRGARS